MPNESHKELNERLICDHLCGVTDNETAWVLLQDPGFIGFGVVDQDKICWPPNVQPDWVRIRDLRLFGEKGEWHVWPHWDEDLPWKSRLLKLVDITDSLTEYHALWGTKVECGPPPWVKLVEERGAEIWLLLEGLELTKVDLPLRLKLKQVVSYDEKSHLAGIVDAALVGLVRKTCEKLLIPASLPLCSESRTAEGTPSCLAGESSDTNPAL